MSQFHNSENLSPAEAPKSSEAIDYDDASELLGWSAYVIKAVADAVEGRNIPDAASMKMLIDVAAALKRVDVFFIEEAARVLSGDPNPNDLGAVEDLAEYMPQLEKLQAEFAKLQNSVKPRVGAWTVFSNAVIADEFEKMDTSVKSLLRRGLRGLIGAKNQVSRAVAMGADFKYTDLQLHDFQSWKNSQH